MRKERGPIFLLNRLRLFLSWLVACGLAGWCSLAPAQGIWREGFNGPNASWHPAGADLQFAINSQRRIPAGGHSGQGAEQIRLTGANGSFIYFSHAVPSARIVSELSASAWIKADRPGLQIFGHVVLPHTLGSENGRRGDRFASWRRLFASRHLGAIAAGEHAAVVGAASARAAIAAWARRRFPRCVSRSGLAESLRRPGHNRRRDRRSGTGRPR